MMCMEPISTLRARPVTGLAPEHAGPRFENGAAECYKPTVNESETIIEAQPLYLTDCRHAAAEGRAGGFRYPATPHIERS
jgi:hypothetical protein